MPKRLFVALYEGDTVCESRILAATADTRLVELIARHIMPKMRTAPIRHDVRTSEPKTEGSNHV